MPEGERILYHRQQDTRDEGGYIFALIVYDMETGQETQLTDGACEDSYPAWAPDGKFIYCNSNRVGVENLYRMPMDGLACIREASQ